MNPKSIGCEPVLKSTACSCGSNVLAARYANTALLWEWESHVYAWSV